jgi:hypothetical protein
MDHRNDNKVIQKEENTDKSLWQKIKGEKGREVYSHSQSKNTRFDISNKICLIYGYAENLINVDGMSVFAEA